MSARAEAWSWLACLTALLALAACRGEPRAAEPAPAESKPAPREKQTETPAPTPVAPVLSPVAPRPAARVAARSGSVVITDGAGAPLTTELLPLGSRASLGAGARLALDFENGARIELEAESTIALPEHDRGALVLARGALHVHAAGQAFDPRLPLRIATPELSFESSGPALEAWVSAPSVGVTLVAVLSGGMSTDARQGGSQGHTLYAGQALHRTSVTERIEAFAGNLQVARKLRITPPSPSARSALDASAYETRHALLQQQLAAQREATQQQRDAHLRGDDARARALQAEVVSRAARSIELRRALLGCYERRYAALVQDAPALAALIAQQAAVSRP